MTLVVGTAGHIDHGKTALLRALTGIDADRLPEERRLGMTIDVGYAHLQLGDGTELDFVDVPGHDRLVGNMLVGAGEIDAVMLVVAADDGPRAQTIEHLDLLVALGMRHGLAVVTKIDLVDEARVGEVRGAVERLLAGTGLAGSPILAVSSVDGAGIPALAAALLDLRDRVLGEPTGPGHSSGTRRSSGPRLAVDRVFTVRGRGLVVTGTLRGGELSRNTALRLVPGERSVRAREIQVHGRAVERAGPGRTAINLAGVDAADVHRGDTLTTDPGVVATDRILVELATPLPDRTRGRMHVGTAAVDGAIGRAGRDAIDLPGGWAAAVIRLAESIAVAPGDRFVIRRGGAAVGVVGGVALDAEPARGVSRRRQTPERVERLAAAIRAADPAALAAARLDLHGAIVGGSRRVTLADDVVESATAGILRDITTAGQTGHGSPGLASVRAAAARSIRRAVTLRRDEADTAAASLVEDLTTTRRLVRDGDRVRLPGTPPETPAQADPALVAAMERLVAALSVAAPPALSDAARAVGCPMAGVVELERSGRIVVLEAQLAYATSTYRDLEARALELARRVPLTPAILRDVTGTSRKYVMAILGDLDRRGILRRTDAGHVPGPRAGAQTSAR